MTSWMLQQPLWTRLHNPKLRARHTYQIARRATSASGRSTPLIRLLCCALVLGAGLWATAGERAHTREWLLLIVVPFCGATLAVIDARAEIIHALLRSRIWPLRLTGWALQKFAWQRINLPGVLETVGPLLLAWMVGAPMGPFAEQPAPQLVAAAATLLYSALGTLHWATESIFYQPEESKAWPVEFARLMRAAAPAALALVYGLLLARNTAGATAAVPWLAAAFLLIYPAVIYFERVLTSAEIERRPAVQNQRLVDATVVHARISNPLHYVLMSVRDRPALDMEALIVYLRGELERCLQELDNGHAPATIEDIVGGVRDSLLPPDRARLHLKRDDIGGELESVDASIARSVLADLCCNGLKTVRDGEPTQVQVSATYSEDGRCLSLEVADNGPGTGDGWQPGVSLRRLKQLLQQKQGDLLFSQNGPQGTVVRATWQRETFEGE